MVDFKTANPALQAMMLTQMFKYHPPKTETRIEAHEAVNKAALEFARTCFIYIHDPEQLLEVVSEIKTARMKANQYITYQEILEAENLILDITTDSLVANT